MARKKRKLPQISLNLSSETKKDIFVVFIFVLAFLSLLSTFNMVGSFGQTIERFWQSIFGWGWWLGSFLLLLTGYLVINSERYESMTARWVGILIFTLSTTGLLNIFYTDRQNFNLVKAGGGGGVIGYLISTPLENILGFWGGLIVLLALILIAWLLFFQTSFKNLFSSFRLPSIKNIFPFKSKISNDDYEYKNNEDENIKNNDEEDVAGFEHKDIDEVEEIEPEAKEPIKPKPKKVKLPPITISTDLLDSKSTKPSAGDVKANQEIIKSTLKHFGIEVEMEDVSVGPTVTQYSFKPASGVKVAQITTLSNDLALALAAHPIRIEAPIPGKSLIGIEVPNQKIAIVPFKDIITSAEFKDRDTNLSLVLGKDVAGKPRLANLAKMPHLLVAGATGSGKTVCLNSLIVSLLFQNQPDELKFIMVDPKQVEMVQYNDIPYLICPVISNVKETINALRWSVKEMEERFKKLAAAGKRNIDSYNSAYPNDKIPYLVIVVDELADLMTTAAGDIEQPIIRLAQKARAVGIHLILATQRPSVNVITGLIKANITARVAFSVASGNDSRTILDHSGAEKLLGRGDMLFITADLSKPLRIQGTYLNDNEIDRVVEYLKQQGEPDYIEEVTEKQAGINVQGHLGLDLDGEDELLSEAQDIVVKAGKASSSYLQRRLRIGYARAARLLDLLEEKGVVGPAQGSKPREILARSQEDLEDIEQDNELGRLEQLHEEMTEKRAAIQTNVDIKTEIDDTEGADQDYDYQ